MIIGINYIAGYKSLSSSPQTEREAHRDRWTPRHESGTWPEKSID
ncbi:hypothetical protein [uncultured Duncaniella sp.]|nr:hypothetical protein [uncultured Duncaniella sp.]